MPWNLRRAAPAAAASAAAGLLLGGTALAAAPALAGTLAAPATAHPARSQDRAPDALSPGAGRLRVRRIVFGAKLRHRYRPAGSSHWKSEPLTSPDDTTIMRGRLFAAFQNGVGPQGQASADGNTDSTVVEFTPAGRVLAQWDVHGKCDGLTGDPARGAVIATVNEDAHSSLYTITPGGQVRHYRYSRPLPSKGGTDAISVYRGQILISASAPGTTGKPAPQPYYPAVYRVRLRQSRRVAAIRPLFYDEARATVANLGPGYGRRVRLALTDPDSNEVVPASARRFAGDFMLTSQGDKEQIFARPGRGGLRLAVLRLSQSVDDTGWVTRPGGRLYASDGTADTIDVVTGPMRPGSVLVDVTPCDADNAPATCPAPGFPPYYLGSLDPFTGHISRVPLAGPNLQPGSALYLPGGSAR